MLKRWLKIAMKVMFALVALIVLFMLFERFRGQISVAQYRRVLQAKGEKVTPQDLLVEVPAAQNGAPEVNEATRQIQEGKALLKHSPPRMQLLPSGRAIVGILEDEWVEDKTTNRWEQVKADLKENDATLTQIRNALGKPALNNNLDYSKGFDLLLPHLRNVRTLALWFAAESQCAVREDRNTDAAASLVAQARLPRLLEEDRLVISELVRIAIAAIARSALWESLQSDALTADDLARVQEAWTGQNFAVAMAHSLEGDRIYSDASYNLFRKSNEKTISLFYWTEESSPPEDSERPWWERNLRALPYGESLAELLKKQIYCRVWRFAWSHQDQRHNMEELQQLTELTRLAAANKSLTSVQASIEKMQYEKIRQNSYDRLRFPNPASLFTLSKAVEKAMRGEVERSVAICAIALKRYSLRHGKLPVSLEALVPEFLASVPVDYMDGKPMKYHLNADGSFRLYSVGEDGKDDNGDASLQPDKTSLRDLWSRKDFVWPAPALPEEVEAYRRESAVD